MHNYRESSRVIIINGDLSPKLYEGNLFINNLEKKTFVSLYIVSDKGKNSITAKK